MGHHFTFAALISLPDFNFPTSPTMLNSWI